MDRITENLLAEFSKEHQIERESLDKRFEHFVSYITVRKQYSETFRSGEIVVGSGLDTGIDAVAILVNGVMVADIEEFNDLADKTQSLDVQFIFVQAETSSSFDTQKIGQFGFGVCDFFESTPKLPRNDFIKNAAEIMSAVYTRSSKFKRGNPVCRLSYITTGRWIGDANLEARRTAVVEQLKGTGLFKDVEFSCIGAEGIQKLYNQTKNAISREFVFTNRSVIPEIPNVSEAYLGFISASSFLNIIRDESGNIIKGLFYDNVRDWENYNDVNEDIKNTICSENKSRFILMNNGITIISRTIRPTGNKFFIEDFQIVNGCQTSHVLADQSAHVDDTIMIPLRLIGTQDEEVSSAIIKATNSQTEVRKEQFFALSEFSKKVEQYFRTFSDNKSLYYERRSHQYDSVSIEKTRIVTPPNLIKAFAAMFLNEPHATTRSYGSLTDRVGKDIFADGQKLDPYYVSAFALYKLEYMFRVQKLASEYKPARFHILLAARLLANPSNIPQFNSREMEKYCKSISDILWDSSKSDDLFVEASKIIEDLAEKNFHRDNIRTQPFTESVIKSVREKAAKVKA